MAIILTFFLLIGYLVSSFVTGSSFEARLDSIVKPYVFSLAGWEVRAIPQEISLSLFNRSGKTDGDIGLVREYFQSTEQIKAVQSQIDATKAGEEKYDLASLEAELSRLQARKSTLESPVEKTIERQIRDTLTEQGIFSPLASLKINFPPVNFKLESPLNLLVISPRDRIESIRTIMLKHDLTLEEIENIEAAVDKLDVSSLVVPIGGLGATYPTFVADDMNLRATIDAATEEWVHQYLAFKPLGFLYVLDLTGLRQNYEIATMNETLASMVSKEIGGLIYQKYYAQPEEAGTETENPTHEPEFDFNHEMREIRKQVDLYLARGEIERAEKFMEEKRQYLASQGYYLRKLNQAYFAFYGTYADSPTSIDPIGQELKELRAQSASLRDFLNRAAAMTSRQALQASID
jgi:predicted  nucleic acid-binding Zn-ribbon protein